MQLKANVTFGDTLKQAKENQVGVTLHLRSGETLQGSVGDVGDHQVVLSELVSREFYDALVRLDDVSAIEVRAQGN